MLPEPGSRFIPLSLTTVMLDSSETDAKTNAMEKDEAELARMGYKQQLK